MAWSGQERIAFEAGNNDGIFGRLRDNPYNIATVPRSYRAYEEGYDTGTGSTTPPRGPVGQQGIQGIPGNQGIPGSTPADGSPGLSFLQGTGPPAGGLGNPGDTYYDTTTTGDIYNKTGPSTWTFVTRIGEVTLALQLDDVGGAPQVLYKGEATAGQATSAASWRVQRITIQTDNDIAILWADGNVDFDNVWDDRLGLAYS